MTEFYAPNEIRYIQKHCLYLLHNLPVLSSGYWPTQHSGYNIDAGIKSQRSHKALFTTPIEYGVELTDRLEKCEIDGLILLAIECWGESVESLSRYLRKPEWAIKKSRKNALRYISSGSVRRWINSKKRRAESYHDFKERGK